MNKPALRRCAVYTRKSSEEGLEQDFNSLHAQREACEAFIQSQKGEGWKLVPAAYDDGGLSGGNMERPGLKRLLQDIKDRQVDIVVVYKVDRLTRSLADFAKMMEVFDASSASFVSVTQQFNTTSSMGRLTLNILLSFAQFEREVTGERIRDKIAASKKKGIWMGGLVPLGYDAKDRKLVVNPVEAEVVRGIFRQYLELGSVHDLKTALDRQGVRSKARVDAAGKQVGERSIARGALYTMLRNPIYLGEIRHKTARHAGQHEAIIDRELWDQVQAQLDDSNGGRKRVRRSQPSPLLGKLFDEQGLPLVASHAVKSGKRYRYYTSKGASAGAELDWRLPADELESAVRDAIDRILDDPASAVRDLAGSKVGTAEIIRLVGAASGEIEAGEDPITTTVGSVTLRPGGLDIQLKLQGTGSTSVLRRFVPISLKKRGSERRIVLTSAKARREPDSTLLKVIARSRLWLADLVAGKVDSITDLARREGVTERYVSRLLPLAHLAPKVVESVVLGESSVTLTAEVLTRSGELPPCWSAQNSWLKSVA